MNPSISARIESAVGMRPARQSPLGGGCVADVSLVALEGGDLIVAKVAASGLAIEGWMLEQLTATGVVPIPQVLFCDDSLLLLEYIENDSKTLGSAAQRSLACYMADLHAIGQESYGLSVDTVIGGLPQTNRLSGDWASFFGEHRLVGPARLAEERGALPPGCLARIEQLAGRVHQWIGTPQPPGLIHGDLWQGNVLVRGDRVVGLIDPAVYYADPEVELAFATLFSTVSDEFFNTYRECRELAPGFFEVRRDLYNLYPLLVHAALFGGSYGSSVDSVARRFA